MKTGFGFFCFGEKFYFKGTEDKIKWVLNKGHRCYILTDNPEYFKGRYTPSFVHIYKYNRVYKSYHDKVSIVKQILSDNDVAILMDVDCHIKDYSVIDDLVNHNYQNGITYVDVLTNHPSRLKTPNNLNLLSQEWSAYRDFATYLDNGFGDDEMIWEYLLIFNKSGFNEEKFFEHYEKLQLTKEFCDVRLNKPVNGAGEGISVRISAKLSDSDIQRDTDLYEKTKEKIVSINKRFIDREHWPDFMK